MPCQSLSSCRCKGCVNPVTGTGCTSEDIGVNANVELVDKFCYLGDMLSVDGDADAERLPFPGPRQYTA